MATKQQIAVRDRMEDARQEARNYYLTGEIDLADVGYMSQFLLLYPVRSTQKKPINLILNTPGGGVYAALGIYDTLRGCGHKIHTKAVGVCMSAGVLLLQAGDERVATPNTTFMIHEAAGFTGGYVSHAEASQKELTRVHTLAKQLIEARIGRKLPVRKGGTPTFLTAEQALEMNLIDRIEY